MKNLFTILFTFISICCFAQMKNDFKLVFMDDFGNIVEDTTKFNDDINFKIKEYDSSIFKNWLKIDSLELKFNNTKQTLYLDYELALDYSDLKIFYYTIQYYQELKKLILKSKFKPNLVYISNKFEKHLFYNGILLKPSENKIVEYPIQAPKSYLYPEYLDCCPINRVDYSHYSIKKFHNENINGLEGCSHLIVKSIVKGESVIYVLDLEMYSPSDCAKLGVEFINTNKDILPIYNMYIYYKNLKNYERN